MGTHGLLICVWGLKTRKKKNEAHKTVNGAQIAKSYKDGYDKKVSEHTVYHSLHIHTLTID